MKNPKNLKTLNRAELKEIKGGTTPECEAAWVTCNANCAAGFSPTGYYAFAQCINDLHPFPCSPLAGWSQICGQ